MTIETTTACEIRYVDKDEVAAVLCSLLERPEAVRIADVFKG